MYLIKTEKIFPYRIMHISLIFFQWWKIDLSKCKPNSNRLTLVGEKEGERMKLWFKTWLQSSQFFSSTHHSQYFIGQVIILGSIVLHVRRFFVSDPSIIFSKAWVQFQPILVVLLYTEWNE